MHKESTTPDARRARPTAEEIATARRVLDFVFTPAAEREWEHKRQRREAVDSLVARLLGEDLSVVFDAVERWVTDALPPEGDCECAECAERFATLETLGRELTVAADKYTDALTDLLDRRGWCEECGDAAKAEMVARKGDDFDA